MKAYEVAVAVDVDGHTVPDVPETTVGSFYYRGGRCVVVTDGPAPTRDAVDVTASDDDAVPETVRRTLEVDEVDVKVR